MEAIDEGELCYQHLNNSCRISAHPQTQATLIYVLLSCVSLTTVTLNLLVIISITHFRELHTPTNLFLLSLAVSDLLVGFLLMPVEIIYIETCWFLGDILCTLYYVVDYIITSASVANMVLISFDRYVAICDPLHYTARVTKRKAEICVFLCWFCSIIYRILLLNDHLEKPGKSNSCLGECVVVINNIAGVIDLVFTFIIPIVIIISLYVKIFVVALSQIRAVRAHNAAVPLQRSGVQIAKKAELKAARTLGIVVAVFLICFCPYFYPALTGEEISVSASSAAFDIWLAHFNSCLNPVIYAFFYPWFRKSLRLILTFQIWKPGSRDVKGAPTSTHRTGQHKVLGGVASLVAGHLSPAQAVPSTGFTEGAEEGQGGIREEAGEAAGAQPCVEGLEWDEKHHRTRERAQHCGGEQ
ncbi:trace amine-associated receptor 13c-like [Antennarius striatus]|uniref:trace amine-associated receptor 13c-like n=1 Tax=Antennarius striatus TaxID=241820 RepID=UPI0035AE9827